MEGFHSRQTEQEACQQGQSRNHSIAFEHFPKALHRLKQKSSLWCNPWAFQLQLAPRLALTRSVQFPLTQFEFSHTFFKVNRVTANNLDSEKKILAVSMLAEGNSIRAVERMTGVHRDNVMRLGVRVG